jgi:2-iminobutanoate/2-iminopropanoate deaminase
MIRGGYKIRAQEATMTSMAFRRISIGITAAAFVFGFTIPLHAQKYVKGKTVWLGGQIATVDDSGKSLAGDFEGQVRQIFKLINATLEKAGGKLKDMVQMTVFITDVRNGDRLTEIRREIFGDNFPGSALITVTGLADPNAKIEIQGYAVIGSK